MREIKFRAWDKRTKQMFENDMLLEGGRQLVIFAKRMSPNLSDMENAKGGILLPTDDKNLIFMQYTGLMDNNGKEGYHKDLWMYHGVTYTVEWDENEALFYLKHPDENAGPDDHINMLGFGFGEIIGNAYEHPHLLDKAI